MGTIHHFALTVSNLEASSRFYGGMLKAFGYKAGHMSDEVAVFEGNDFELILYKSDPELPDYRHELYQPGYHHVALKADDRAVVDRVGSWLIEEGWVVLEAPREYPAYPGDYYAVFFLDPDGLKWEVMTK